MTEKLISKFCVSSGMFPDIWEQIGIFGSRLYMLLSPLLKIHEEWQDGKKSINHLPKDGMYQPMQQVQLEAPMDLQSFHSTIMTIEKTAKIYMTSFM